MTELHDCWHCGGKHEEPFCPKIMDRLWDEYKSQFFAWYIGDSILLVAVAYALFLLVVAYVFPLKIVFGIACLGLLLFVGAIIVSVNSTEWAWETIRYEVYKNHTK